MSYNDAATAAALGLVQTSELQEMIAQSNLFLFDNKGRLSSQMNHKLLNLLNEVQTEIPTIYQLEDFVQIIDSHLLMVVSKKKTMSCTSSG